MPTSKLNTEILQAALLGFEAQKRVIDERIAEVTGLLGGSKTVSEPDSEPTAAKKTAKPKRKLSAAGRAAIIAALKKRWAQKKLAPDTASATPAKKTRGRKAK
jgi:hypothetical protein